MTESSTAPVLAVQGVSHTFGRTPVLHDVHLDVPGGAAVAIQGRSGSGKSTLLAVMMGLMRPRSGLVTLDGSPFSSATPARRAAVRAAAIGVVFQHAELLGELTAVQNVVLPALLTGAAPADAERRARGLLADLSVEPDRLADVLSGGERQRVGVARALINGPRLVLADEPTGALDAELRDTAADLIFGLPRRTGCALVVVTHDPLVAARADRRYVMTAGRLGPLDSADQQVSAEADPSTAASRPDVVSRR